MTMKAFADHILAVAKKNNIEVTNLDLQKTMYFVLRNSSSVLNREQQEEIYDEPFLVWRYGPVVESQYERFSIFGAGNIEGEFSFKKIYEPLNKTIKHFLKIPVFNKVKASHTNPFWINNENKIRYGRSDVAYPLSDVIRVKNDRF